MSNAVDKQENVDLLWQVLPCVLLIVGTIGNVLSLIVLCRKSMRKSRLTRYLICLSVADLLVLYIGLLLWCIELMARIDIRNTSSFLCKFTPWMLYSCLDVSAWILVLATLERSISVWKPLKVIEICTNKITITSLVLMCVVMFLVNGHFLFGFNLLHDGKICNTSNNSNYEIFQEKTFPWLDLFFFSIGPFICQLVGNTVIIVGLVRHSKTLARYSINRGRQGGRQDKLISSITIMLMFLNVTYLVFTLPISVHFLEKALWDKAETDFKVVQVLYYLNTSTNFIAYIISGRRFRLELWSMVRGRTLNPSTTMILSRASTSTSQNLGSSVSSVYSVTGQLSTDTVVD